MSCLNNLLEISLVRISKLLLLVSAFLVASAQQGLAAEPIAVSLIIDHSGSMGSNDPNDIRIASARLAADLMESGSDWGAVIGFDDSAVIQVAMTRDMNALKSGISESGFGGGTDFGRAFGKAVDTLGAAAVSSVANNRRAAIFFTDGKDSSYSSSTLQAFIDNSWRIYCIGFGDVNDSVLQSIASATGGQYRKVTTGNMQEVMPAVIAAIRGESPPTLTEEALSQDEHVTRDYYVSSSQVLDWIKFTAIWEYGSAIDFYVVSPSGTTFRTDFSSTNYGVYTINNPESGTWVIHLVGTNAADGTISVDYGTSYEVSDYGQIKVTASPSGSQCKLGANGTWYYTPHTFQNVSPGSYTIYCRKTGYNEASKTVSVSSGQVKTVSFSLTQQTGTIQVSSAQDGAECRLGSSGTWYPTPHTYAGVGVGSYTIYCQKTDYHTASQSIYLSSNETENVSFNLQPVGDIDISFPTADYNWERGVEQTIAFTSQGVTNLKVELYKADALVDTIAGSLSASAGQVAFTPSSGLTTANDYRVKITSLENSDIFGWSPDFRIVLKTIRIGGLTIRSDGIWETSAGSDVWIANGNTTINEIVSADAALTVDVNSLTLSGNCGLSIGPLAGDIVPQTQLWSGQFEFDVVDTLLELGQAYMDVGNDMLKLAGCPLQLYEFAFMDKGGVMGIEIKGSLTLPDEWGGLSVDFGSQNQNLRIDKYGIGFSGTIAVPDIQFATWGLKDTTLTFNYWDESTQTRVDFFSAETVVTFPAKFDLEAALAIRDAKLNRIGFGVDAHDPGIQIIPALPQPGVIFFQKAYGEAYNLASPDPWGVRLGKSENGDLIPEGLVLTAGPEFNGYYALKAKFGMDINSAGYMWGNGDLFVFNDDFNIAGGDVYLGKDYGAYLGGWVVWDFNAFSLENDARIMLDLANTLRGQMTGKMSVNWPWDDFLCASSGTFLKVSEVDSDDLPDKYIVAWVDVCGVDISAMYNFVTGEAIHPANTDLVEEITFPETSRSSKLLRSLSSTEKAVAFPDLSLAGQYIFILKTSRDIVGFELEKPDGTTRITPAAAGEHYLMTPGKGALFVVDVPQEDLGQWTMVVSNTFNSAGASVEVRRVKPLPQVDRVHVSSAGNNAYRIEWEDFDPSEGLVTILCSLDGTLLKSIKIADLPASSSTNSIIWSTEEVASGEYTIIVMMERSGQIPVIARARDLVSVIDSDASGMPSDVTIDGSEGVVTVSWEPVPDAAGYTVEYRDAASVGTWPSFTVVDGSESQVILTGLMPGRHYQVRIQSYNENAETSPWAGWYDIELEAAPGANSTPAITGGLSPMARSGTLYQGSILYHDADGDAVTFFLQDGPSGFSLDSDGSYTWTPDDTHIGWQSVIVQADDGNTDGTVTRTMSILVSHASASESSICRGVTFEDADDIIIETWGNPFTHTFVVNSCFDGPAAILGQGLPAGAMLVDNGNGTATLTWTPEESDIGTYDGFEISASDGYSQISQAVSFTVKDMRATISSPQPEARVSGSIDIRGTCYADQDFASGVLEIRPENGTYAFIAFIATVVQDGILHKGFDTTVYPDGVYEFRLKAMDYEGNYAEQVQRVTIDNTPAEFAKPLVIEDLDGNPYTCVMDSTLDVTAEVSEKASIYDSRLMNFNGTAASSDVITNGGFGASLNIGRNRFSSVEMDGKIYVIGGYSGTLWDDEYLSSVEVYDAADPSKGWQLLDSNLKTARYDHSSVAVDGKIYVTGGTNDYALSSVEVYDTADPSKGWQLLDADLLQEREQHTSVVVDKKIYVIGGFYTGYLSNVEVFDTTDPTQGWQLLDSTLSTARSGHSSAVVDKKIYVIGGWHNEQTSEVEIYDTTDPSKGWQLLESELLTARSSHSSAILNEKIYAIGGYYYNGSITYAITQSIEVYDTTNPSKGWQLFGSLIGRSIDGSSEAMDGRIYVIGAGLIEKINVTQFNFSDLELSGMIPSYYSSSGDTFRLEIQLIDEAGNISDWLPSNYMVIDTTPPVVTVSRPSDNANCDASDGQVEVAGSITDDLSRPAQVLWSKNGTDWTACSLTPDWQLSTWRAQVPVLGFQTTFQVKGIDTAGNESDPVTVTANHYSDMPVAEITAPSGNVFQGTDPVSITGNVSNPSGHSGFSWSLEIIEGDGTTGTWQSLVAGSTQAIVNSSMHNCPAPDVAGLYTLRLTATNSYGTISTSRSFNYFDTDFIDEDGDGLPDNWEIFSLGYLLYDGDDDPDQDQSSNRQEFFDETDPMDAVSSQPTRALDVSSDASNGTYITDDLLDITVRFNDRVTVSGAPQISLETGDQDAMAEYVSGSGTDTLVFRYSVASDHETPDLDYTSPTALLLNGGSLVNSQGAAVDATLPVPGEDGSLGANKDIVIGIGFLLPVVSTSPITDIETDSARGGGTIASDGGSTISACGVCWGTAQNPTIGGSHTTDSSAGAQFTSSITGLNPAMTYYVRAYATNITGTAYGENVSFKTFGSTGCPDCSGATAVIENYTFTADSDCYCGATESITFGPNVTVKSGARVRLDSSSTTIKAGVNVENGAELITTP